MALLATLIERPAEAAKQRQMPLFGMLAALLLHSGVALAALYMIENRASDTATPLIEVVWPSPAPAAPPVAAAPVAAAAAEMPLQQRAAAPPPPPKPEALPEPKPLPPPEPEAMPEPAAKPVAKPPPVRRPVTKPAPALVEAAPEAAPGTIEAPVAATAEAAPPAAASSQVLAAAPAAPPVPRPPAASPYGPILLAWLQRYMEYPRHARLKRQEGEVRLRLVLDRSGRLLDVTLAKTSGHEILDEAALSMARRAAPYPPPLDFTPGQDSAGFVVPVLYNLTN